MERRCNAVSFLFLLESLILKCYKMHEYHEDILSIDNVVIFSSILVGFWSLGFKPIVIDEIVLE